MKDFAEKDCRKNFAIQDQTTKISRNGRQDDEKLANDGHPRSVECLKLIKMANDSSFWDMRCDETEFAD